MRIATLPPTICCANFRRRKKGRVDIIWDCGAVEVAPARRILIGPHRMGSAGRVQPRPGMPLALARVIARSLTVASPPNGASMDVERTEAAPIVAALDHGHCSPVPLILK